MTLLWSLASYLFSLWKDTLDCLLKRNNRSCIQLYRMCILNSPARWPQYITVFLQNDVGKTVPPASLIIKKQMQLITA